MACGYINACGLHADVVSRIAVWAVGGGKKVTGNGDERVGLAATKDESHVTRSNKKAVSVCFGARHNLIYPVERGEEGVYGCGVGGGQNKHVAVFACHKETVGTTWVGRHRRQTLAKEHLRHIERTVC